MRPLIKKIGEAGDWTSVIFGWKTHRFRSIDPLNNGNSMVKLFLGFAPNRDRLIRFNLEFLNWSRVEQERLEATEMARMHNMGNMTTTTTTRHNPDL